MSNLDLYPYLRQIARNQSDIKLLNIYKGLPISYDAQISFVGDSEIQVHSSRAQLACLYYQQETYLQCEGLPFVLRSQVISLHLGKEDATLANLEVASNSVGNRSQIRVEPEEPLIALIQFSGAPMSITAPIADISAEGAGVYLEPYISAEGAGVYLEPYMYSPRLCQPGNQVSVSIALPDTVSQKIRKNFNKPLRDIKTTGSLHSDASIGSAGTVVISTIGKITSVHSELIRYRVGMRLMFKDLARTVILQYISQRQSEIIRDLSVLSEELYGRKK
jgi:hypothetical protein